MKNDLGILASFPIILLEITPLFLTMKQHFKTLTGIAIYSVI